MILEIYQKDKSIPNVYHILEFEPTLDYIWFTIKETHEEKKFRLEGIKSYCIHNDSYSRVIYTSLSQTLKKVMNGDDDHN